MSFDGVYPITTGTEEVISYNWDYDIGVNDYSYVILKRRGCIVIGKRILPKNLRGIGSSSFSPRFTEGKCAREIFNASDEELELRHLQWVLENR